MLVKEMLRNKKLSNCTLCMALKFIVFDIVIY